MAKTKPASGMRDFLPEAIRHRRHVVSVIEAVYQSYGFEPLETPSIESLDTLLGKYGDEGDQLLYRLLHRRDKLARALGKEGGAAEADLADQGLRYDLTVPLARVMARHGGQLPRFFRRYQIQPVWRADRPGKGRFREFYQCDADVTGTASLTAEAELCQAVCEVLERLGFEGFTVHLNHRELLRSLIAAAGIEPGQEETALVAIDKLDKIGREGVRTELAARGVAAAAGEALLALVVPEDADDDPIARLEGAGLDDAGVAALASLQELLDLVKGGAAERYLKPSPALARGLGYYTGAIFEISVPDLAGSLGGGGRYDGLIGMFSGKPVPAVGFSIGLERILVVMEDRGMFPALPSGPDVLVCGFPDVPRAEVLRVARALRATGKSVEVYPEAAKLGKQLKYATQLGAREAAIVGASELAQGIIKVKDLATGEQRDVPLG